MNNISLRGEPLLKKGLQSPFLFLNWKQETRAFLIVVIALAGSGCWGETTEGGGQRGKDKR